MRRRTYLAGALAAGARFAIPGATLVVAGCSGRPGGERAQSIAGPTMGTLYQVRVVGEAPGPTALTAGVERILEEVVRQMSTYRPDSELTSFNTSRAGDWMPVSRDLHTVLEAASRVSRASAGAFDVTVGPLVNLWGFGPAGAPELSDRVPSDEAIADAAARIGHARLSTSDAGSAIAKDRPDVYVDLSGIAKGFAVDKVARYLDGQGLQRYLVEIGGELRARGSRPDGNPWRVGIERPVPGQRGAYRVVALHDHAIATSGDYRNYFERGTRRYSHTIDARTGRPVAHGLASVSVIAPETMTADAMSTALMVLGPEEGYGFAREHRLAAHFMTRSPQGLSERWTPEFAPFLQT